VSGHRGDGISCVTGGVTVRARSILLVAVAFLAVLSTSAAVAQVGYGLMPTWGRSDLIGERTIHVSIELVDLRTEGKALPATVAFLGTDATVAKIFPRDKNLGVRVKVSSVGIGHIKNVAVGLPTQVGVEGAVLPTPPATQGIVSAKEAPTYERGPRPQPLKRKPEKYGELLIFPGTEWEWYFFSYPTVGGDWTITVPSTSWPVGSNSLPIRVMGKFQWRELKFLGMGPRWLTKGEVFYHVPLNVQQIGEQDLAAVGPEKFFLGYLQGRGWISATAMPMMPTGVMTGNGQIQPAPPAGAATQ